MRRVLSLALCFSLLLSVPAAAQTGGGVAKSVEVSVTNVDVVVTDAHGKPIPDLTAADFEVRQDGVLQPLSHFSFVRNLPAEPVLPLPGEKAPAPTPAPLAAVDQPQAARAHLIVFVDQLHLTPQNKNRALRSLRNYLPTVLGPNVDVQFVTWDRSLRIRGPFTNDAAVVSSLIGSLELESAIGDVGKREHERIVHLFDQAMTADANSAPMLFDLAIQTLRAWCDEQAAQVMATIDALRASFSAVSGVEGRKVLFLLTEKLTPAPGRDLWDYAQYGSTRAGSLNALNATPRQRRGGGTTTLNDFSFKDFDRSSYLRELTTHANAAGVSLVTIDTEGITTDEMINAERSAAGGRMDEGILQGDMQMALGMLAEETGGKLIVGRNELANALRDTEADWTAYYSLGYESPNAKPGSPRAIRVTVHRPGAKVRSRKTVVERTADEKVADAVLSQVHIPRTSNPLRASLTVGKPKKDGKMWLVPLEFHVPFDKLTLVPQGGRAKGALVFTAVAATPDGRISPVTKERAPIDVPERELQGLTGKTFTYTATLKVRGGPQILSTGLTDEVSRLTSYVQPHVLIGDKAR